MADSLSNNNTISKYNAGFPGYLDFDKLRTEGIAYLGKLAGKIWTDHNVHDPGITILEELCYALLDLGYRTNLPVVDILSKKPGTEPIDTNFFSPAQILTCNPLTITDYRKLIIDIPGIRNAWMIPADDIKNICTRQEEPAPDPVLLSHRIQKMQNTPSCEEFLNGIYHVFIETEKDIDRDFINDDPAVEEANKKAYIKEITGRVKKELMAHRNLCEDFADIFILCKLEVGVCASIELEEGADPDTAYLDIAHQLQAFLSSSPKFYTLPQLLDKGKAMEDIFAGRPYSSGSHGFIDTDELESIPLRKEIHLSDIYNAIFQASGVKKVTQLKFRSCGKDCNSSSPNKENWRFHLPENHIPVFSLSCSGLELKRKGKTLVIDREALDAQLELEWLHTGKVWYKMPSPYLDSEIPKGIYHDDLDQYESIQNDFPHVYGIGEGDLPANVSDKRKAQALQLKGFLFFFDQILANYLSQLKNIRQLFAYGHPKDAPSRHSYFLNTIQTVPELNSLLRFGVSEGDSGLGMAGTILAFPVSRTDWNNVDTSAKNADDILNSLIPYAFDNLFALGEATELLQNDLINEADNLVQTYLTQDGNVLYAIFSSTDDFVMVSRKISQSVPEALRHAASVQYAGVFEKNYRSYIQANNTFTFDIELTLDTYTDYLGILVESEALYLQRREDFLKHLLSRFAESFTDFVLLNWNPGEVQKSIGVVEDYLSKFPDLGRNRGRAFDYWDESDTGICVSGFENKVKALAGIPTRSHDILCPFTVELFDETYIIDFRSAGLALFQVTEKFDLKEDALQAAASLIQSLGDHSKFKLHYLPDKNQYQVALDYGSASPAIYHQTFPDSRVADALVDYITQSFSKIPPEGMVFESRWSWTARILDPRGNPVRESADLWYAPEEAAKALTKWWGKINDTKKWKPVAEYPFNGELYYDKSQPETPRFVDITAFNLDINDTVLNKPGKFTYDVLDKGANTFKISPAAEFDTEAEARDHCYRILVAAGNEDNYTVRSVPSTPFYTVDIVLDGKPQASTPEYPSEEDAQKARKEIQHIILQHSYSSSLLKQPVGWKFRYQLGYEPGSRFEFISDPEYTSEKAAREAEAVFYSQVGGMIVSLQKGGIQLQNSRSKSLPTATLATREEEASKNASIIGSQIEDQMQIDRLRKMNKPEALNAFVKVEGVDRFGTYVYRLIDKNHIPAVFRAAFPDKKTAWNYRKKLASLSKKIIPGLPGICLGGDILEKITDKNQNVWYRYKIMFYNLVSIPGDELVLFESVAAFASAEEATQAFHDQYLKILGYASGKSGYDTYISTTPVDIPGLTNKPAGDLIAYIPAETLKLLKDQFGANWLDEMIHLVRLYPVKIIDPASRDFAEIFCQEYKDPEPDCAPGGPGWKYYFSIPLLPATQNTPEQDWVSTTCFDTAEAALEEFRFFSRLLRFTGNYYVDCGCTKTVVDEKNQSEYFSYKIFIHEVLAQGIDWYETEDLAWGPQGVEKFICAMQNGDSIRNYLRRDDCCYSFYVTCGKGLLEHPCKYDSESARDQALERLFREWEESVSKNAYGYGHNGNQLELKDRDGKPFAKVRADLSNVKDPCDWYILLAEEILSKKDNTTYEKDGYLHLLLATAGISILSADQKTNLNQPDQEKWIEQWNQTLWLWACYFPITRTRIKSSAASTATTGRILYKYCIELKLPSFSLCEEDLRPWQPCDSVEANPNPPHCNIAWKSSCCFASCAEALRNLEIIYKRLSDKKFLHAVFDCPCDSFGIAFNTFVPGLVSLKNPVAPPSDVIAVNPQCYDTPKEECEAVTRARDILNSEGLHLVEHILLRPYTQADCECRGRYVDCKPGCDFPDYIDKGGGACAEDDKLICFKPGTDPYSFIATAFLPAWSTRFRNEEGRNALEKILYTEAPAHVLLRILWLKPRDFCSLEWEFFKWKHSLSDKKACADDFNLCRFLEDLFHTTYDCLEECVDCIPCRDPGDEPAPNCLQIEKQEFRKKLIYLKSTDLPFTFLNQVNRTYCFSPYCPPTRAEQAKLLRLEEEAANKPTAKEIPAEPILAGKTIRKVSPSPVIKATHRKENTVSDPSPAETLSQQEKAKLINARFRKYKSEVKDILEATKGNPLAVKTDRYISGHEADADRLEVLVDDLLANKKPSGKGLKALNKVQQLHLLRSAISFYLDKISFNGKEETDYQRVSGLIAHLKKDNIDLRDILRYWNQEEAGKLEPGLDTEMIRKLLLGLKK